MTAQTDNSQSSQGEFWDKRYSKEGAIWGEVPSPTAQIAGRYMQAQDRVLDIGFGYGRDLAFYARRQCLVWGVDLSQEGCRQAEARLREQALNAQSLIHCPFEDSPFPECWFDVAISHRVLHLLIQRSAVDQFVHKAYRVLKPEGILCVG